MELSILACFFTIIMLCSLRNMSKKAASLELKDMSMVERFIFLTSDLCVH